MKEYMVTIEVSGYCRGYKSYKVKADNKEEAKDKWSDDGELVEDSIIRDDREYNDVVNVDEIKPKVE